jgi:hypothetical protein
LARRSKCARREETMASSAMAKKPLSRNSAKTTIISMISISDQSAIVSAARKFRRIRRHKMNPRLPASSADARAGHPAPPRVARS